VVAKNLIRFKVEGSRPEQRPVMMRISVKDGGMGRPLV